MNLRCKPGQMCRIIKATNPDNVGGIVQCLHLAPVFLWREHGPEWAAKSAYPMRGVRQDTGMLAEPPDGIAEIPDAWLEPIEPPATPEVEEPEEALTA